MKFKLTCATPNGREDSAVELRRAVGARATTTQEIKCFRTGGSTIRSSDCTYGGVCAGFSHETEESRRKRINEKMKKRRRLEEAETERRGRDEGVVVWRTSLCGLRVSPSVRPRPHRQSPEARATSSQLQKHFCYRNTLLH